MSGTHQTGSVHPAAKFYAAALAAITNNRPDLPPAERAALADAIEKTMLERGLIRP